MSMVDIKEIRARLRERQGRPAVDVHDWRKVLVPDGVNALLLGLIIARAPTSIGELTELAGRAQPNVSRSLSALVRAGLVELQQNKRASTPVATALGLEKAAALEISVPQVEVKEAADEPKDRLVSVRIDPAAKLADQVRGWLDIRIPFKDAKPAYASRHDDLTRLAERLSSDWWRILYRREAYHLADVDVIQAGNEYQAGFEVQPKGGLMEMIVHRRSEDGEPSRPARLAIDTNTFAASLKEGLMAPVARELTRRGEPGHPLFGHLAHLEEIEANEPDLVYWRTAGALGLGLGDDSGDIVEKLIDEFPAEDARLEFASAVLPESFAEATAWIENEMTLHGSRNRLTGLEMLARQCKGVPGATATRRGIALARRVRKVLRLVADRPIGGFAGLASAMGAADYVPGSSTATAGEIRGFRSDELGGPAIVIDGSQGALSSTFLLARGIGDYLAYGGTKAAITDVYTDRQRLGRAFAAELIAPAEAVVAMVNEGQPRQRVARHFGAMSILIDHQFENNARAA